MELCKFEADIFWKNSFILMSLIFISSKIVLLSANLLWMIENLKDLPNLFLQHNSMWSVITSIKICKYDNHRPTHTPIHSTVFSIHFNLHIYSNLSNEKEIPFRCWGYSIWTQNIYLDKKTYTFPLALMEALCK